MAKAPKIVKESLNITAIILLGIISIVFAILYFSTFNDGIFYNHFTLFESLTVLVVCFIVMFTIITGQKQKEFIFKISYLVIILIAVSVSILYLLKISGFFEKVESVDKLREYIQSFNGYAVVLFIVLQFLQVVILPIPGVITVGAGVLLFGPLKGALFSLIGILLGSIVAFYIGRKLGYKVVKWLVGEESLKNGLKAVKGKDRLVLTFMFLFPFFPDDVLCFVAGLSTMGSTYFIVMITITRVISIFTSSYSLNNSLIPYTTWWGIIIWIVLIGLTIGITVLIYRKGDKIESNIKKAIKRLKQRKANQK